MHIANINFQNRVGKFGLSSGNKGSKEKKLIQDSLDIWTQKLGENIKKEPNDNIKKKQYERFKNTKKHVNALAVLEDNDKDFELLDNEESNRISYNDICDIIKGIHEYIRVLENDGSYLDKNYEKYWELRRILSELNDQKMRFVRTVKNPYGLSRRRRKT